MKMKKLRNKKVKAPFSKIILVILAVIGAFFIQSQLLLILGDIKATVFEGAEELTDNSAFEPLLPAPTEIIIKEVPVEVPAPQQVIIREVIREVKPENQIEFYKDPELNR